MIIFIFFFLNISSLASNIEVIKNHLFPLEEDPNPYRLQEIKRLLTEPEEKDLGIETLKLVVLDNLKVKEETKVKNIRNALSRPKRYELFNWIISSDKFMLEIKKDYSLPLYFINYETYLKDSTSDEIYYQIREIKKLIFNNNDLFLALALRWFEYKNARFNIEKLKNYFAKKSALLFSSYIFPKLWTEGKPDITKKTLKKRFFLLIGMIDNYEDPTVIEIYDDQARLKRISPILKSECSVFYDGILLREQIGYEYPLDIEYVKTNYLIALLIQKLNIDEDVTKKAKLVQNYIEYQYSNIMSY